MEPGHLSALGLYGGTAVTCAVSAVVPLLNTEAFLLLVSSTASPAQLPGLAVVAAVGQMAGKTILYLAGRGLVRLPFATRRPLPARWSELVAGPRRDLLVFASAAVGLPPFYAISIAAGTFGWSLARFVVVGTCGRLLRFASIVVLPLAVREVW